MPPKKEQLVRKTMNLPAELLKAVEDFRYEARIPTETEAIRTLIEAGLRAEAGGRKVKRTKA